MKISELEGAPLDLWVVKAEGLTIILDPDEDGPLVEIDGVPWTIGKMPLSWSPSTNWAHGGPLIERAKIGVVTNADFPGIWIAAHDLHPDEQGELNVLDGDHLQQGLTPLIAAMRCYVASKFGEELPEE